MAAAFVDGPCVLCNALPLCPSTPSLSAGSSPAPPSRATPLTVEQVAQHFYNARRDDVRELLETLAALGHVEATDDGAYAT